jgi:hypothetical protein
MASRICALLAPDTYPSGASVAVKARVVSPGVVQDIVTKLACLPEGWLS